MAFDNTSHTTGASTEFTRRGSLSLLAALATTGAVGTAGAQTDGTDADDSGHSPEPGHGIEQSGATLNRFAHTVPGAEVTGMFVTEDGQFFFNVQHPDPTNVWPRYSHGAVGVVQWFDARDLPHDFPSVQIPDNEFRMDMVETAFGHYRVLAHGGDETDDGEPLGVPQTPDGVPLSVGTNPDFNGVVPDGDGGYYVFTNWESRPGMMSRLHVTKGWGGWFEVESSTNVDFRPVEGTWVNCFGTVSPWGTPLSGEENYEHTARADWNNPAWSGAPGVMALAEYLGAQGNYHEVYPNPYRYGYIVEITEPTSDDPTPRKLFTLGRCAHENAVFMPDGKTAYTSSDGTGKGFYRFVADEANDPTAGTLSTAKATQQGPDDGPVTEVAFDIEWVELGHATTAEIESWIADYDDITVADYEPGENSYITDKEIAAWAAAKQSGGGSGGGNGDANVPEELRRVPFLETREAAKAVGATTEFRKMEGLNVRRNAEPGEDYLYMAMSNTNATMSDDEGDIQLDGDEWGAVYRLPLREGYDVDRMEPIVVGGPNANICGGCPYDANPNANSKACQSCSFNPTLDDVGGGAGGTGGLSGMSDLFLSMARSGQTSLDPENTIAEPDNLVVLDDGRVVIGEDTGNEGHDPPNMVWVFDPGDA